jgi:hypothetical protein
MEQSPFSEADSRLDFQQIPSFYVTEGSFPVFTEARHRHTHPERDECNP